MEIELQKATHEFLLKQFTAHKIKKPKENLVSTAAEYYDAAVGYE